MTESKEVEGFAEAGFYFSLLFPFLADGFKTFRILAVLRATSFAHSSVVADDRLPVPVREKSGSGL